MVLYILLLTHYFTNPNIYHILFYNFPSQVYSLTVVDIRRRPPHLSLSYQSRVTNLQNVVLNHFKPILWAHFIINSDLPLPCTIDNFLSIKKLVTLSKYRYIKWNRREILIPCKYNSSQVLLHAIQKKKKIYVKNINCFISLGNPNAS